MLLTSASDPIALQLLPSYHMSWHNFYKEKAAGFGIQGAGKMHAWPSFGG